MMNKTQNKYKEDGLKFSEEKVRKKKSLVFLKIKCVAHCVWFLLSKKHHIVVFVSTLNVLTHVCFIVLITMFLII